MKTVFDLYVDGTLLCTLSESQAKSERKRLGRTHGVEFRQRFDATAKNTAKKVTA